jgi:flap endonuclease-1
MGVKLSGIIPSEEISFRDLSGKKIAVDFSNCVYQFLSSIRQQNGEPLMDSKGRVTSHLMGTWTRFSNLIGMGIKLVVVFDGKSPEMKTREKEKRAERKIEAEYEYKKAVERRDIKDMYKYAKRTSRLDEGMIKESKELIKAMGLPIVQAPSEADAQMAFMNEKGDVWACATTDFDPFLHGAPRVITNLTLSQRRKLPSGGYVITKPYLIELDKVLKELKLNRDQLIALAILVGTDYNEGVKGVGPKTGLRLVRENKNFDKLFKDVKAEFNWKKIFAIFKSMPVMKNYQLKWNEVDVYRVKKLLVDEHEFSEERVDKTLKKLKEIGKERSQEGLSKWV